MALSAQVGVIAAPPVFANGSEQVQGHAVFQRFDRVGNVGGNLKGIARFHDELAVIEDKTQTAFLHCRDLFVAMVMTRHNGSFSEREPGHRYLIAVERLTVDQRVQGLYGNLAPTVQFHRAGIVS